MGLAKLNIVTALACEARPLIDYYQLKKVSQQQHFPLYANQDRTMHLMVSGVGKIAAAAATAYMHVWTGGYAETCYLNLGIAGGYHQSLGELYVINKIVDYASQKAWYPAPFVLGSQSQAAITTVDQPQAVLPKTGLVDMEAAAFFATAGRFVNQEQVHLIKLISDNHVNKHHSVRANQVEQWIKQQYQAIADCVSCLLALSREEFAQGLGPVTAQVELFCQHWHFTHYQRQQLQTLLRRWLALYPNRCALEFVESGQSSSHVMTLLAQHLAKIAPSVW